MSRQILTFLLVFVAIMFIFPKACAPKVDAPPAVGDPEKVNPPLEEEIYRIQKGDLRAVIGLTGTLVSVHDGDEEILRTAPAWRRPFHVLVRRQGTRRGMPRSNWTNREIDGGLEFSCNEGTLQIVKRITFDEEGNGLNFTLSANGGGKEVLGLELTGASGVRLSGDGERVAGAYWDIRAGERKRRSFHSVESLVQERESKRALLLGQLKEGNAPKRLTYEYRESLGPGDRVDRFGVLGATRYVELAGFGNCGGLNVDTYRAEREGSVEIELETWVSLSANDGEFDGEFRLHWGPRAERRKNGEERAARQYTLEDDTFRILLTDRGAAIEAMWLKQFSTEADEEPTEETWVPILHSGVRPGERALTLRGDPGRYGVDPAHAVWEALQTPDGIRFTLESPKGYRFEKTIRLPEGEGRRYDLGVEVRIEPPTASKSSTVKYQLIGPSGSYVEDSFRGIFGAAPPAGLILERRGGDSDSADMPALVDNSEPLLRTYDQDYERGWPRAVGARGAFFVCALVTEERTDPQGRPAGDATEAQVKAIKLDPPVRRPDGEDSRDSLRAQIAFEVPVGDDGTARSQYRLYAGPTEIDELRPLRIEDAVDFGMFGFIGRALMWLMKTLESLVGSMGVAIVLMTLIVRACLLPVSYRTQLGMQRYSKRIQKIKPLLDEIQEKYASNKQKLNQERMRVMREHKVGFPLGCLMIFFQFPIWIALFGALRVEFSLRHEPFLWAMDLTMPDRLLGLPFWPHWFNFLPILMLGLWVMQQRLTPQPGGDDPQVRMQMKMVKFMPYFFFFMLYNYASALAVYMCVSSAWGIAEAKLVRRAIARLD
ncbi:MAG: YidC/Oxa1 family insertase periplasmic-domain containing protein [Planctomycetota bacterium]|jgi:YidC/Oxa1 family membrane protein insertase